MTGWSGSGYRGPDPVGGSGRQEDEEATTVRPATPPAPPRFPQPGYGQAQPPTGYPTPAPGYGQAPPPPAYPAGYGPGPNATGYGDLSGHLQRAGYGQQPPGPPGYGPPGGPAP